MEWMKQTQEAVMNPRFLYFFILLFFAESLLCEEIIDSKDVPFSVIQQIKVADKSIIAEYKIKDKGTITIANHFIDFTSESYSEYGLNQSDSIYITYREGNEFLHHKVLEIDIKGNKFITIFLLFNNGDLGFYLFKKDMRDVQFFFLKNFKDLGNIKTSFDVKQKKNIVYLTVNIGKTVNFYNVDLNKLDVNEAGEEAR